MGRAVSLGLCLVLQLVLVPPVLSLYSWEQGLATISPGLSWDRGDALGSLVPPCLQLSKPCFCILATCTPLPHTCLPPTITRTSLGLLLFVDVSLAVGGLKPYAVSRCGLASAK